jgi:hypothetical protein
LENKLRGYRHQLALAEDGNASLKLQAENTSESLQHALAALKRTEVALAHSTTELNECKSALAAENIQSTQLENKRLREQCIEMRVSIKVYCGLNYMLFVAGRSVKAAGPHRRCKINGHVSYSGNISRLQLLISLTVM